MPHQVTQNTGYNKDAADQRKYDRYHTGRSCTDPLNYRQAQEQWQDEYFQQDFPDQ